ncbi:proteasome activator subunit 4-like [Lycium barbarum]|uniref:proteasome activator subunit 4-like n=1 Tax=Lycium barbarum TaxID=112863 RepID=UPI00293E96EF|nr:proteasome activator subunit 4-like [Lycium barbarum]
MFLISDKLSNFIAAGCQDVTLLAQFVSEPSPVKSTVTKAVAEFRRTHADTWNVQKDSFTEEQLEVLADTSSSSSYFA